MLSSLHRRPRTRRLARVLDVASDGRIAAAPAAPPAPPAAEPGPAPLPLLARPVVPGFDGGPAADVSSRLASRLPAGAAAEVEARLPFELRAAWASAGRARECLLVPLALHHGVAGAEATGLLPAAPPPDIHAMAAGPLATGGDLVYADIVAGALATVGAPLAAGQAVLDFGCSSGRVIRVLHAYEPELRCLGCDPNGPAIAWAREHLPGIQFFESPTVPPLALADDSVDVAFAISIWSHFSEPAARAWLEEMSRIVAPGGHLLLTAQGWQSIAHFARVAGNAVEHQRPQAHALYTHGYAFVDVFTGPEGDWGVSAQDWGMGFLTAEWLAEAVTPAWSIVWARVGAIEGNQDLYVLRREPATA